jgi:hypothetical protein
MTNRFIIVQIIYPKDFSSGEEKIIEKSLSPYGYDLRFIGHHPSEKDFLYKDVEEELIMDADISIFFSGWYWESISHDVDKYLYPNLIILTGNPGISILGSLRPVAIISRTTSESIAKNIVKAIDAHLVISVMH